MVGAYPTLYRKYISYGKRVETLQYVHVQKALCGSLKNTLIFYKKLVGDLKSHGFEINRSDQ